MQFHLSVSFLVPLNSSISLLHRSTYSRWVFLFTRTMNGGESANKTTGQFSCRYNFFACFQNYNVAIKCLSCHWGVRVYLRINELQFLENHLHLKFVMHPPSIMLRKINDLSQYQFFSLILILVLPLLLSNCPKLSRHNKH